MCCMRATLGEARARSPVLSRGWVRDPSLPARRGGGHLGVPVPRAGEKLVRACERDVVQGAPDVFVAKTARW